MQMGCVETEVQLSQVEEWMRLRWLEMAVDEIIAKWRIEARATSEPVNKVVVDECHKQVGLSSGFLDTPGKISSMLHVGLDWNWNTPSHGTLIPRAPNFSVSFIMY